MDVEHTVSDANGVLARTRDAVLVYDTDGALVDANDAARDTLPDALLGMDGEAPDGADFDSYRDALLAVRDGHREDARVRLGADDRALDARLTPVRDDAPRPVCAVLRDCERDPRVDDLALLNRLVRHDVRNRVIVVGEWVDHLRERADPDERSIYDRVVRAVDDVVRTTETACDATRAIVNGRLDTEAVALAPVLEREAASVRREHPDATVDVSAVDSDVRVAATPMLGPVFYNLLQNAVVHNPAADPHVAVDVAVDPHEDTVTVSVADDGPGIPSDALESVFERGVRGSESAGDGLGLYLVATLVEAFGGDIDVSANDPEGTVFDVTLRRA